MDEARQAARQFFGRNDVFAETANYLLRDGKQRFAPEELCDLEGMEIKEGGKPFHVPEERDLMRFWNGGDQGHLIIALDLAYQPAWPTEMRYRDALTYYDEFGTVYEDWATAAAGIRKQPPVDGSVYLTELILRAPRDEKLIPVISLNVNLQPKAWDTPITYHEMLHMKDPEVLKLIQDYGMYLLDPYNTEDDVCRQFQTELRYILPMLKYRDSPEKLEACFRADKPSALSPEALELLRTHGYPDQTLENWMGKATETT